MSTTKRHPVRALVVLLVAVAIGIGALVFGHQTKGASYTPALALDLEGGTQLILTPVSADDTDRAVTDQDITEAINVIRQRVDASGVAESEITALGSDNISVALPGHPSQETLDLIRRSSQMSFRPVLQVTNATTEVPVDSGTTVSVEGTQSGEAAQSAADAQSAATTAQSGETTQSGEAAQSDAAQSGESAQSTQTVANALPEEQARQLADTNGDGEISDEPATTPENNSDLAWVTEQALVDLYTLDCSDPEAQDRAAAADPAKPVAVCDQDGYIKYLLGPVDVSGADLESASAGMILNDQGQATGQWGVNLQFDSEGTQAFSEASQRLYSLASDTEGMTFGDKPARNHFAAVLDGVVITAPSMNSPITDGRAQITGSFTVDSAKSLANQLNFGSLPLNFEVQSEQQISATLGSDHLEKGIWAGVIGLLLVVAYMIWQYRGLAILSAGSLVAAAGLTYLVITLLSWLLGYRLSLAGVAGLIVSVGVTADSFIVYFERIRDEVRDGRPLVAAVDEGWDRAKRTIIVSDMVNLLAAVVLYVLAVGGVQGFAFTLGVTTLVDLVVIFLFTHPLMELLIRIPFFGNGHKLSGLDPEHLGAKSGLAYAGRGRVVTREKKTASPTGDAPKSLAERRREAALAERERAATATATGEADPAAESAEDTESTAPATTDEATAAESKEGDK